MIAAGPFDDDAEESWRVSENGRHIWTGDTHLESEKLNKAQQAFNTKFWGLYDAQMAQKTKIMLLDRPPQRETGELRFPDVLPQLPYTGEELPMFASNPDSLPGLAFTQNAAPGEEAPHNICSSEHPRDVQTFDTLQPFVSPTTPPPVNSPAAPQPIILPATSPPVTSLAASQPFISPATPPPTSPLYTHHTFTSPATNKAFTIPSNPTPT